MIWLFMTLLWTVMLLAPVALLIALLPTGRDCPRCTAETLPIRSALLRPLRKLVSQRWCPACGWEGMARVSAPQPVPVLELALEHDHDHPVDDDAAWRGDRKPGSV
jgi:hypothetical protein